MKIGISGSRTGMSDHQRRAFEEWIAENAEIITEFHHGMCVGADAEAHGIVRALTQTGQPGPLTPIHGHPGFEDGHMMRAKLDVDTLHGQSLPMDRNRAIADECDLMFFAPTFPERQRSGTWATFRYCRKKGYRVVMLARGTYQNPEGMDQTGVDA